MADKIKEISLDADMDLREPLMVSVNHFKGQPRFDVRHYYEAEGGEMRPTKKGINIPLELVPRLIDALVMAYNESSGARLVVIDEAKE